MGLGLSEAEIGHLEQTLIAASDSGSAQGDSIPTPATWAS
jgi:hypothetical protein